MNSRLCYTILFVLLHQTIIRRFVMVRLLIRHRTRLLARQQRQICRTTSSYTMIERITSKINHLRSIIETGNVQCGEFEDEQKCIFHLYYLQTHVGGLGDSRYVWIEENVAMFLSILAHHKKNRIIGHNYIRSGQTINAHFHEVLGSVLKLHTSLLVKPSTVDDTCTDEIWKWFKVIFTFFNTSWKC